MKKTISLLLASVFLLALAACSAAGSGSAAPADTQAPTTQQSTEAGGQEAPAQAPAVDLSGKTLMIYCGAGMTKPFTEIANTFEAATGCAMEVTFANAGQIQTQINTAQEGDLFIAGSAEEVKPVGDYVTASVDLVKHIPVLAVAAGNPKGISGLQDLTGEGIAVVLGDADATPLGKIANKAFSDFGIMDQVNVIARSATAPAVANALIMGECDAVIVWKENTADKAIQVLDTADMEPYIKTIPAASLSFTRDDTARSAFLDFLNGDTAKGIWTSYGYEVLN